MITGIKHVVQCRCIMNQFKRLRNPPNHKFVVFSVINDDAVIPKFVQCNNCGLLHKVVDIGRTEITGREHMTSLVSVDELKSAIPEKLVAILEANNCDAPTWEMASFILENKRWGDFVVLTSDVEDGTRQGKFVKILGENLFKVETFTREEIVKQ